MGVVPVVNLPPAMAWFLYPKLFARAAIPANSKILEPEFSISRESFSCWPLHVWPFCDSTRRGVGMML